MKQHPLVHLEELRRRLFWVLGVWVLFSSVVYVYTERVYSFLVQPLGRGLIFTAPQEAFLVTIKLAVILGGILTLPIFLYHSRAFLIPGLKKKEQKILSIGLLACIVLFCVGAGFAFVVVLPLALNFLLSFGGQNLEPLLRVSSYIGFVLLFVLSFGLVFQLPLLMAILSSTGLVSPKTLAKKRRSAVVVILLAAAFITPPDAFTLLLMAGPLVLLYEIGILVSRVISHD